MKSPYFTVHTKFNKSAIYINIFGKLAFQMHAESVIEGCTQQAVSTESICASHTVGFILGRYVN